MSESYKNIARVHSAQGRYDEALDTLQQIHVLWEPQEKETALDAKHPHVVSSYTGIAALYEAQGKPEEVVGAQAALKVGLRVKGAAHIEHSHTQLECPRGGAGTVTKVSADRDACFVKWDMTAEECGWYPCGAHGRFSLILLPRHEEKPFYVLDMMRTGGNSEQHIHLRVADYSEKHFYTADSIVDNVIDLLG